MKRGAGDAALDADSSEPPRKRLLTEQDVHERFRAGLFDTTNLDGYTSSYAGSVPYKHGVISNLFEDTLLRNVRNEIRDNIHFSPKETDIYKIHQSGDLANLDGLPASALARLPSLVELRDALYSAPFRKYLSGITGSGPLSGTKTDMAVNVYTPGCHLLCHDDVIGSRRVSYILYLTDPERPWQGSWGGALRLYPTKTFTAEDGVETKVPSPEFSTVIPPAFNQLSFFAVQPGESFHDVEEVYARPEGSNEDDGGRIRMAISGWFHIPQPGEDGYEEGAEQRLAEKSSLAQLQGRPDQYDLPRLEAVSRDESDIVSGKEDETELTEDDLELLIRFMNPRYLTPDTVAELAETFAEESSLQLGQFLAPKFADPLKAALQSQDHAEAAHWSVARPPHKHRYLFLQPAAGYQGDVALRDIPALGQLLNELFPSAAFSKWLALATGLSLTTCNILARRFRRGLDYTLAQSYEEDDPRLEICLGITPSRGWGGEDETAESDGVSNGDASTSNGHATASNGNVATENLQQPEGGVGGYELYMAGDDEEEAASDTGGEGPSTHTGAGKRRERADPAIYKAAGDEDDGILFSMPASWNMLSIVLRDKGVLRFVKYVSRSARGDRWDICGEWGVIFDDEDEDDADVDPGDADGDEDDVGDDVDEEEEDDGDDDDDDE